MHITPQHTLQMSISSPLAIEVSLDVFLWFEPQVWLTELKRTILLTILSVYHKRNDRNSWMEERHRARHGKHEGRSQALSECTTDPKSPHVLKSCPFGLLERFHCVGMSDEIIGHWQLVQPPASLLLLVSGGYQ